MVMLINKKINDKNNSKLKTLEIINYEVKQSKMMFLFIFVLFKQQHSSLISSNFNSSIFDDEYQSLTFVFFYLCIVIIMHILIH